MDNFRHNYVDEMNLMTLQRTDKDDTLIVRDSFTLERHDCAQVLETLLKAKDPFFRELALQLLIAQNLARPNHII